MTPPADTPAPRPEKPLPTRWQRLRHRVRVWTRVALLVVMILFVLLFHRIVHVVPAGHAAVLFRPFTGGVVMNHTYPEGLQITFPWNSLTIYDVRVEEKEIETRILTENGLEVDVSVSARFHPIHAELTQLHKEIGPDYVRKFVVPVVVSSIREVAGEYTYQGLYHISNEDVQDQILAEALKEVDGRHIHFDSVIVRSLVLPELINIAIREKLRQEQLKEEYQFRLQRERDEATRKKIEAGGIKEFQELVQSNLTEDMLRWRGIQATVELANSENSKVVVIGSGNQSGLGLPIIMGGWDKGPDGDREGVPKRLADPDATEPSPLGSTPRSAASTAAPDAPAPLTPLHLGGGLTGPGSRP